MDNFKIMSCNCQGLGNLKKRRDIFQYLREKKCSVYFLQDTHFDVNMEKHIRSEWGYECYFSSFNSQSRGVGIMFNNNFEFKVNKIIKDENGNFLIVDITTLKKHITLINIYGPNRDNPDFNTRLEKKNNRK